MDSILGDEKETMFDVPETKGKTIFMLDRIQEVSVSNNTNSNPSDAASSQWTHNN